MLRDAGLPWYEISNWSRPGRECRHNQLYWSQGQYRGIGCAAHSHRVDFAAGAARRWWNVRTPERYAGLVVAGRSPEAAGEDLDPSDPPAGGPGAGTAHPGGRAGVGAAGLGRRPRAERAGGSRWFGRPGGRVERPGGWVERAGGRFVRPRPDFAGWCSPGPAGSWPTRWPSGWSSRAGPEVAGPGPGSGSGPGPLRPAGEKAPKDDQDGDEEPDP